MKKSYLTLAAVAAIMASCTNEVLIDEPEVKDVAISFETFNNKATKAENSGENNKLGLEDHHLTFSVWGYKDVQATYVFGTSTTVGQKVAYGKATTSATVDTWFYTPVRFWDKNSNSYEFYAAAPETTSEPKWTLNANDAANQSDDYFTLSNVTLVNSTLTSTTYVESMKGQSNTDYMIASPKNVALVKYGEEVQLDFNHILSRLNVTVKKGANLNAAGDDGKVAITSFTVYNMPAKGSFDESKASGSTLSNGTNVRWTAETTSPVLVDYTGNALADVPFVDGTTITKPSYILQSLVMPQVVGYNATVTRDGKWDDDNDATTDNVALGVGADPYIKIVYTIGKTNPETYTANYNLASLFGTTNLKFSEGWQNILNITIDADAIVFDPEVYNWDDAETGDFPIQ